MRHSTNVNQLWSAFLRHCARHSVAGEIRTLPGLEAAWVNSLLPFNNGTYLSSEVQTHDDLARRLHAAKEDAAERQLPWGLFTYDPWLAGHAVPPESGFAPAIAVKVMTGHLERLAPPARPLPLLEMRRIVDDEGAKHAFDINMLAYGMPLEMGGSLLAAHAYFNDPAVDFGFVAYEKGEPVSTTTVIALENWLYVALVATHPDHRQKGYADAVMRHALAEAREATGLLRTSLDATAMGGPVYAQMGYEYTGESWTMYTLTQ